MKIKRELKMKSLALSGTAVFCVVVLIASLVIVHLAEAQLNVTPKTEKPRSIITSDGEIDDE